MNTGRMAVAALEVDMAVVTEVVVVMEVEAVLVVVIAAVVMEMEAVLEMVMAAMVMMEAVA